MNMKYLSKNLETKDMKKEERKLKDLRVFAKKELFAISQKQLSVPIYLGQL